MLWVYRVWTSTLAGDTVRPIQSAGIVDSLSPRPLGMGVCQKYAVDNDFCPFFASISAFLNLHFFSNAYGDIALNPIFIFDGVFVRKIPSKFLNRYSGLLSTAVEQGFSF